MGKILKILKINILSVVSLPLLLLATAAKLIARALEKTLIILGTLLAMLVAAILFEILRDPGELLQNIVWILVAVVLAGFLIAIIFYVLSLLSAFCMMVIEFVIGVFDKIYELVYSGFASLYEICQDDYEEGCLGGSRAGMALACLFYTILRLVNKAIILFVSHSLKIFLVLSVLVVAGSVYQFHTALLKELGIGLITYIKLFPFYNIIYALALWLIFVGGVIVVLISLGIEWSEWGEEMDLATSDYHAYSDFIRKSGRNLSGSNTDGEDRYEYGKEQGRFQAGQDQSRHQEELDKLDEHVQDLDSFLREVSHIVENSSNQALRSNFGAYMSDLKFVLEEFSQENRKIPREVLQECILKIKGLDRLKRDILRQVRRYAEESREPSSFFAGCDTSEKLDKRYKALCRTYHPDGEAGDEETFKKMKAEYEQLKQRSGMGNV